jgi:hypothetical protein
MAMRLMIDIRPDLSPILSDLAARERRTTQQQAAYMLEQALLALARCQATPASAPVAMPDPDGQEDA